MTSSINFGAIDATFPIAGQDNDSNGFRENFSAIQSALAAAKSEIEDIQTKAVLTETLGSATDPVANNLGGSSIAFGVYSQLNGVVPDDGLTSVSDGTQDVDLDLGPFQVFRIVGGNATLRFTNWATEPVQFSLVRVHLVSDANAREVILACENSGTVIYEAGSAWATAGKIAVDSDGLTHTVFEAWSYDGANVFVRSLGDYLTPA